MGAGCAVSMTTSWPGWFLPQISIYNRILRKTAKGGGENPILVPSQEHAHITQACIESRTQDGSPSNSLRTLWGGGSLCSLFFLLPQRISSPYNETKALQNQDLMRKVKGIRKDI